MTERSVREQSPNHLEISVYGPFHRKWSPTQTDDVIDAVLDTGELWGGPPFGSDLPAVEAFAGPLPQRQSGFEFYSRARPDNEAGPRACWRRREDGSVRQNGGVAKMSVMIARIRRTA